METSNVFLPGLTFCSMQGVLAINYRERLTHILVRRPVILLTVSTTVSHQLTASTALQRLGCSPWELTVITKPYEECVIAWVMNMIHITYSAMVLDEVIPSFSSNTSFFL